MSSLLFLASDENKKMRCKRAAKKSKIFTASPPSLFVSNHAKDSRTKTDGLFLVKIGLYLTTNKRHVYPLSKLPSVFCAQLNSLLRPSHGVGLWPNRQPLANPMHPVV